MPFKVKQLNPIDTSSLDKLGVGVKNLAKYTVDEFGEVASALQGTEPEVIWYKVPPKPRRGTIVYADGTNWNPGFGEGPYWFDGTLWHPMNVTGAVKIVRTQIFTASGTYTPNANLVFAIGEVQAAGGAGGGSNCTSTAYGMTGVGGNSGGYSKSLMLPAAIGVSQTVTLGAAGAVGAAGAAGGSAGNASIGSLCTANGGQGGAAVSSSGFGVPLQGPAAGVGNIMAVPGRSGQTGYYTTGYTTTSYALAMGAGADSMLGAGGVGNWNNATGNPGQGYGSGGSGGSRVNVVATSTGGAGAPAIAIVTEFCSQ